MKSGENGKAGVWVILGILCLFAVFIFMSSVKVRMGRSSVTSPVMKTSPLASSPVLKTDLPKGAMRMPQPELQEKDFGELPELPRQGKRVGAPFVSLMERGQPLVRANATVGTTVSIGEVSCKIPRHTTIHVVAQRYEYVIAEIDPPCRVNGKSIGEGYVPRRDIRLSPTK